MQTENVAGTHGQEREPVRRVKRHATRVRLDSLLRFACKT